MKYTEVEIKKAFDDFKDYTDKVISGEVNSFNTMGRGGHRIQSNTDPV